MKMLKNGRLFFLFVVLFLSGCASPTEKLRVYWPPLPEQPRLEWQGVYYSKDDMNTGAGKKLLRKALGEGGADYFVRPSGVASDGEGRVYVADVDKKIVKLFDFNRKEVEIFPKNAVFQSPFGLALDKGGNLYVADGGAGKVLAFSPTGQQLYSFTAEGLKKPAYLAINNRLGRLYVSDGSQQKIVVFDLKGQHLFSFGTPGSVDGAFLGAQGVAVDGQDRVFVADQLNARVQVFDAEGKFLYKFGQRGDRQWNFEGPKDLAFDGDGNLHVLDVRKAALVVYRPEGQLLTHLGGAATSSPIGFSLPVAISIGKDNKIFIAEGFNRRFSAWQYLSEEYIRQNPIDEKTLAEQLNLREKQKK